MSTSTPRMSPETGNEVPLRPDAMSRATARMAPLMSATRSHIVNADPEAAPIFTWLRRLRTAPRTTAAISARPSSTVRLL